MVGTDQRKGRGEDPYTAAVAAVGRLAVGKKEDKANLVGPRSRRKWGAGAVWSQKLNEITLVLGESRYRCANSVGRPRLSRREKKRLRGWARKKKNDLCGGQAGKKEGFWQNVHMQRKGAALIVAERERNVRGGRRAFPSPGRPPEKTAGVG